MPNRFNTPLRELMVETGWPEKFTRSFKNIVHPRADVLDYLGPELLPNKNAIKGAAIVLQALELLQREPDVIRCSGAGGVGIAFIRHKYYTHIESFNDGDLEIHIETPDRKIQTQLPKDRMVIAIYLKLYYFIDYEL